MAGRTLTAKARAQRIDMEYFKRPDRLRRLRFALSYAAPVVGLLWLAGMAMAGSKAPYSSGPVSTAHQVFGQKCERCHTRRAGAFTERVADTSCVACHDAPAHQATQTFAPACASCHADHRGPIRLAAVDDGYCTQCHGNLTSTTGRLDVVRSVTGFDTSHPEFAVLRSGAKDPTVLKFDHQVHMKKDLRGPNGPTTLACTTCHALRVGRSRPVRVGRDLHVRPAAADPRTGDMAPITYAEHCQSCHPLYFDPLVAAVVPHDTPEVVDRAVVESLGRFIAAHPAQVGQPDPVRGPIPVNFPPSMRPVVARSATDWVALRTSRDEQYLWQVSCAECHSMAGGRGVSIESRRGPLPIPSVVPTNMPTVWMPRARFDHPAHRLISCESCHAARTSRATADVLMPSIATCRRCHTPRGGADSRCFECHDYHDWSRAPGIRASGFGIRDVTN